MSRHSLAAAALLACGWSASMACQPANAGVSARGFSCGTAAGAPATMAVTADARQVPVIRWTSSTFNDAGWSQERRCQEVSSRFDRLLKQGKLGYITHGRLNGLPVICATPSKGIGCSNDTLLYTLKPHQNANATLKDLLDIRVKARGPLNECVSGSGECRLYVSIDELLTKAHFNDAGGTNRAVVPSTFSATTLPLF